MKAGDVLPTLKGDGWLARLITCAVAQNACMRWRCTTCGARPFRLALRASAQVSSPGCFADGLVEELRQLPAHLPEAAVRFIILEIQAAATASEMASLVETLSGTPAGAVLESMMRHGEAMRAKRQEHQARNDPVMVAQRRLEKAAERAAAHAARLAAKREREAGQTP
jgi:hypothetical protein